MRPIAETHARWQATFGRFKDISDLKAAFEGSVSENPGEIGLRSVCWKAFLLFRNINRSTWSTTLNNSREAYTSLKEHFLKNIEHSDDISAEDLLNDSEGSTWTTLRYDEELRAEIWQDVERCMPENSYFREPATQNILLEILFVYCKLNRDISYRQGMHEVLAPILWVVSCDVIEPSTIQEEQNSAEEIELSCLDYKYIEHDAFTLFSIIMQTVRTFYEMGTKNDAPTSGLVNNSPIVQRSKRIHEKYLHQTDPELAEHLTGIEILPQIFLIRWVRLVFGREFPFEDVLSLWDMLFAEDPELDLIDLISVSMLLRIRWQLLEADYTGALTLLLRYPVPRAPHQAATFVTDALYLREHLNLDGGDFIISKYSMRAPETTVTRKLPKKVKRARTAEQTAAQKAYYVGQNMNIPAARKRKEQRGIDEIIQNTAKGLYLQGEKWGVGRALRGAVQGLQAGQVTPRRAVERFSWSLESDKPLTEQSPAELLSKVESLEQRNKALAKYLESALNELGAEQKANELHHTSVKNDLSLAIARIQFVRVHLDNSSMPLSSEGVDAFRRTSMEKTSLQSFDEKYQPSPSPSAANTPPESAAGQPSLVEQQTSEHTKKPIPPSSQSAAPPSTPPLRPQAPLKLPDSDSTPSRTSRPTLAQSPYSWMLGEEKTKSDFVPSSPLRSEKTSSSTRAETLFRNQNERKSHRRMNSNLASTESVLGGAAEGEDVFVTRHEKT